MVALNSDLRLQLRQLGQSCHASDTRETLIPKKPRKSEEAILAEAKTRLLDQFSKGNSGEIAFRMVQRKRMSPEAAAAWMLDILQADSIWKPQSH